MTYNKKDLKDAMGRYRTQSLFLETNTSSLTAIFTLGEEDKEVNGVYFISLKRLFLEENDPTEYLFATRVFGSWDHWQRICENKVLGRHIVRWREELEIKVQAQALQDLILAAKEGSRGTAAAKWIASGQWKHTKGRPKKEDIERQTRIEARVEAEISDDYERVFGETLN